MPTGAPVGPLATAPIQRITEPVPSVQLDYPAHPAAPIVAAREVADPAPDPAPPPGAAPSAVDTSPSTLPDARPGAAASSASGPAATAGGTPEELLAKLFDPLLRRLKAELRLDRERRGSLTDLRH